MFSALSSTEETPRDAPKDPDAHVMPSPMKATTRAAGPGPMSSIVHAALPVLVMAALAMPWGSAAAQREVSGVLFDSLRTFAAVAGAEVVLLGASRRATTDSAGRFRFPNVAGGADSVAFWSPWLDSLGLPALRAAVAGGPARGVADLATPSPETYQRQRCGVVLAEEYGVLVGEARDHVGNAQAGVIITARWRETEIGAGRLSEESLATVDTTTNSGHFQLCGVPVDAVVTFRAFGATGSGELAVQVRSRVQRQDVIVGPALAVARVEGRVVRDGGEGVPGARLWVGADSTRFARTDSSGRFAFGPVAMRSAQVEIRAIGFAPAAVTIAPGAETLEVPEIVLEALPPELEQVTVTADPYAHERRGFEERKLTGLGIFITDEMLERFPVVTPAALMGMTPRLRTTGRLLTFTSGIGACSPRFFVDGSDYGQLTKPEEQREQERYLGMAKRIEVYRATESPPRYNDNDGCGSIVIWTR